MAPPAKAGASWRGTAFPLPVKCRGVAQPGSASALGTEGLHPRYAKYISIIQSVMRHAFLTLSFGDTAGIPCDKK